MSPTSFHCSIPQKHLTHPSVEKQMKERPGEPKEDLRRFTEGLPSFKKGQRKSPD